MKTLLTLWTVMRSSPAIIRYFFVVLRYLPTLIAFMGRLQEVFGSEAVQELMKALNAFIDRVAPPAPTIDGTGTIPANLKKEQRRRIFRFRNRLEVAGIITDAEAQELCAQYHSNPYEIA